MLALSHQLRRETDADIHESLTREEPMDGRAMQNERLVSRGDTSAEEMHAGTAS